MNDDNTYKLIIIWDLTSTSIYEKTYKPFQLGTWDKYNNYSNILSRYTLKYNQLIMITDTQVSYCDKQTHESITVITYTLRSCSLEHASKYDKTHKPVTITTDIY